MSASPLHVLAASILAGKPAVDEIAERLTRTLGRRWRWIRPLAQRYFKTLGGRTRPREREVVRFLSRDAGLRRAWSKYLNELSVVEWISEPRRMHPAPAAAAWDIPILETIGDLADWLGLYVEDLFWFADLKGIGYRTRRAQLRHYHYRVLNKSSGNLRLIEAPKHRLKDVQLQILHCILENIPPHPAVHGFLKGPIHQDLCGSARWPTSAAAHGPTGFLSDVRRGQDPDIFSLPGLSRGNR